MSQTLSAECKLEDELRTGFGNARAPLNRIIGTLREILPEMVRCAAQSKTAFDFRQGQYRLLTARAEEFWTWQDNLRSNGLWRMSNRIHHTPGPRASTSDDAGHYFEGGLNFASQDYLSLSSHPAVHEAARAALERYGPHSAGSPDLQGNTPSSDALEREIADSLGMDSVVLFPTGWGAGFGAVTGLVREEDHVLLDHLSHNCLAQGARAATRKVGTFPHNDLDGLRDRLRAIRQEDSSHGILVVTEGLFSMNADTPDLRHMIDIVREHDATLLVDVAHDFGSLGPNGGGSLEEQGLLGEVDLVMGAFSKTFASNGGFIATKGRALREYLKLFAFPHTFSNAMSPVQTEVVRAALRIVRSREGVALRAALLEAVNALRSELTRLDVGVTGRPSPIVPVHLGHELLGRVAAMLCFHRGLFANFVEFPGVARGKTIFRMQVMAGHSPAHAREAALEISGALDDARALIRDAEGVSA